MVDKKRGKTSSYFSKNKIDTFNRTEKSQAYNKTVYTPRINKIDKVKSIDKSRSAQIADTENTVN